MRVKLLSVLAGIGLYALLLALLILSAELSYSKFIYVDF